jgi:hypothetical protein
MERVLKHITVDFKLKSYSKDRPDEDVEQVVRDFFYNIPIGDSSAGSTIWLPYSNPHCFYYNVPQAKFEETMRYIESYQTYRAYTRIILSFW